MYGCRYRYIHIHLQTYRTYDMIIITMIMKYNISDKSPNTSREDQRRGLRNTQGIPQRKISRSRDVPSDQNLGLECADKLRSRFSVSSLAMFSWPKDLSIQLPKIHRNVSGVCLFLFGCACAFGCVVCVCVCVTRIFHIKMIINLLMAILSGNKNPNLPYLTLI